MNALDLELIHADIMVANSILFGESNRLNNPCMLNMAAYHAGQAIEKGLKAIIKENDYEIFQDIRKQHNIETLIMKAEFCECGFAGKHRPLVRNADNLSRLNGLRYATLQIDKDSTFTVLQIAKDFYKELQSRLMMQSPNRQVNQEQAANKYNHKPKIEFVKD